MTGEILDRKIIESRMDPENPSEVLRQLGANAALQLTADPADVQPEIAETVKLNPNFTENVESNGELVPLITRESLKQFDYQEYSKKAHKRQSMGTMCWNNLCRNSTNNPWIYKYAVISDQTRQLESSLWRIAGFEPNTFKSLIFLLEEDQREIRGFGPRGLRFLKIYAHQLPRT